MSVKNLTSSPDIHDHIDHAIKVDTTRGNHDKVPDLVSDLVEHPNADKSHMEKLINHFTTSGIEGNDYYKNSSLESILNHPQTDGKTINQFLDNANANPIGHGKLDLDAETFNKPGIDSDKLVNYLSQKIDTDNAKTFNANPDILTKLSEKAKNVPAEHTDKYHEFITGSYAEGHREQADYDKLKPIIHATLKNGHTESDTFESIFSEKNNISHNDLMEMYHSIPPEKHQYDPRSSRYAKQGLINHPNLNKDFIAAAALDSNNDFHQEALQSKQLPAQVVDRLIADNNFSAINTIMDSRHIAPENVEKIAEFGIGKSAELDEYESFLNTHADKLSQPAAHKLYSALRGTKQHTLASIIAEQPNASDDIFMDSVNRGERPVLYNRKLTPELAKTLSSNSQYASSLMEHDDTPIDIKVKIAEGGELSYKDVSGRYHSRKLPLEVNKVYFNQMLKKNKLNPKLMVTIFHDEKSSVEDKQQVLDAAVKGFKSKVKTKSSAEFLAHGLTSNSPEIKKTFDQLKPEHQATVLNFFTDERGRSDYLRNGNIPNGTIKTWLENPDLSENTKIALLENPNVDIDTYLSSMPDISESWQHNQAVQRITKKLQFMPDAQRADYLNQHTNNETFHSLNGPLKNAILLHPESNIQNINFTDDQFKSLSNRLDSGESKVVNKFSPDQAIQYFAAKPVTDMNSGDWDSMMDKHPEPVLDYLSRVSEDSHFERYFSEENKQQFGPHLIDRILSNPGTSVRSAWNIGFLYNKNQDPGHERLKNILNTYSQNQEQFNGLFRGFQNTGSPLTDSSVLTNIGLDFAPGGQYHNENVWSQMIKTHDLPDNLKEIASYTSPRIARQRLAHINETQGRDAEKLVIQQMANDARTTSSTYNELLEHFYYNSPDSENPNFQTHAHQFIDLVTAGLESGKIDSNYSANSIDKLNKAFRDSKDENFKQQAAAKILTAVESSEHLSPEDKTRAYSQLVHLDGMPTEANTAIQNHIINKAIEDVDLITIARLGGGTIANNPAVWSPKTLQTNRADSFNTFADMAAKFLTDQEDENKPSPNPQNWLLASKTMMKHLPSLENEVFVPRTGTNIGKFIVAGAHNPETRDVANLLAKAFATKMSQSGHSENGIYEMSVVLDGQNHSEVPHGRETFLHFFDGIQGKSSFTNVTSESLQDMRDRVTNAHQAALVVNAGDQSKESANDLTNFSSMVSPDSKLGFEIARKLIYNHPFLDQSDAQSILSNLAEKDPSSFFDFVDMFKGERVTSAKMLSALSMNLPHAIDKALDPNTGVDSSDVIKSLCDLHERMDKDKHQAAGLNPEDANIAHNHFTGQMIDGIHKIVDHGIGSAEEDANYKNYRRITSYITDAFSNENSNLNEDNTKKLFNLSALIYSDPHSKSGYKDSALTSVNHVAFSKGKVDQQSLHSLLAENPSTIFSAVSNSNFTMDHLQHYKPEQMFSAIKTDPANNNKTIEHLDESNVEFFRALAERKADFGDEDKRQILQKGLEYLIAHSKSGYFINNDVYNKETLTKTVQQIIRASESPTQKDELLNHIVAHAFNAESSAVLLHADFNPDQTATAIDHLEGGGFLWNLSKSESAIYRYLENLDMNKQTLSKIHSILEKNEKFNINKVFHPLLMNKRLSDQSIKMDLIDKLIPEISSGIPEYLEEAVKHALTVPNLKRNQFDALVKHDANPTLFDTGTFASSDGTKKYINPDFGGDALRDLGITNKMKNTFKSLTGINFSGDVAKYHHGKDLTAFNQLLGMVPPAGLSWKDFKRANPKLAENNKIKNLFMSNKEMVTPETVTSGMSNLPGSYHITFAKWDGIQRHSNNDNLVIQYNLDKSFENYLAEDPNLHKFFIDMCYESNKGGHPVAPRSMMWSRLDATHRKGWIIEEIQSDFDSSLIAIIKGASSRGKVNINDQEYKIEDLEKYYKSFSKMLSDHVDVAHGYIEQLARDHGVSTLHMHGKDMRAELSGMNTNRDVPKWLEYKYETWPQKNGWSESTAGQYPSDTKKGKKKKTWIKKLT